MLEEFTAQIEKRLKEGIIDGKAIGNELRERMKQDILSNNLKPFLSTILVGEDKASKLYVSMKEKACNKIGIRNTVYRLPGDVSAEDLRDLIEQLNADDEVNGILLQLPLLPHLKETTFTTMISQDKDVDGLHYESIGRMQVGLPGFKPCTPSGCIYLLERAGVTLEGAHAVVIGRSNLVGKPMVRLLETKNATVTLCHSRTKDLSFFTLHADIIVAAAGRVNLISADMVKNGAVVIDVGTNTVDGKLVGDVDFENVKNKTSLITPVPGGVGPMTITMLLFNTIDSYKMKHNLK